jgi:cytochrome c554/c'-like protein
MCSCVSRPLCAALILAAALIVRVSPAAAQPRFQFVGPNECLNCHDHESERQWYEKQEIPEVQKRFPAKGANAGHINALKQLESAKSADFARAIGLRDKYDLNGACVRCHATVFKGDANAGVSCESCHGPASGYLKPHQTKGAYTQSLALGLVDIVGKIPAWAQQCASCHVMDDQRLVAAGHPSGDDFDLGEKFLPVSLHFKKKYSAGDVSVISREVVRGIIARRRGGAPPTVNPGPPPPPPPPVALPPAAPPPVTPIPDGPATGTSRPTGRSLEPLRPSSGSVGRSTTPTPLTPALRGGGETAGSVSASMALAQGRLIEILTEMLQRGATVPVRTGTTPPNLTPYTGPDAALLQLQRDAIALALEILGSPPAAPQPAKPAR